jgi:hypothetical protein
MCDSIREDIKTGIEIELWKPIPGYLKYQVSTLGRIRLQSGRISEGRIWADGYRYIGLINDKGKLQTRLIHRLVALAWIDNPLNKPFVDKIQIIKWQKYLHSSEMINNNIIF